MNILLWGIFYIITSIILLYFFLREKQVVNFIRKKEDDILKNIPIGDEGEGKRIKLGNIITVLGIAVSVIFFFIVDKEPDYVIKLKIWGIYGMFILNMIFLVMREQHEWIFLSNLIMLFLGKLMFNILDTNFYIYLFATMILSFPLIFLYRKPSKERISESTVRNDSKPGEFTKALEKIQKETGMSQEDAKKELIEIEKRKQSTLGRAFARMDTAITAVVLVLLIQAFYLGNYVIPTGSMEPTIKVKDRVFANMIKYKFSNPKVGDIVAFKEPVTDKIMYTKRIVGVAGQTLQIKDISVMTLTDPSTDSSEETNAGRIYLDDKLSEVLNRPYSIEALLKDNKIYIPKKGDKVKLDKIIAISKLAGYATNSDKDNFYIVQTNWEGYKQGQDYEEMTAEQFLSRINTKKDFKNIIGNSSGEYNENDPKTNTYYTFTVKVEGRDELVLPIQDFKYNDEMFMKLLNGETVTLDKNYYMAMGDNTTNSLDSRFFGYVAEDRIKGNLLLRWWPLNRVGLM